MDISFWQRINDNQSSRVTVKDETIPTDTDEPTVSAFQLFVATDRRAALVTIKKKQRLQ